jgi:hypothetical protein
LWALPRTAEGRAGFWPSYDSCDQGRASY